MDDLGHVIRDTLQQSLGQASLAKVAREDIAPRVQAWITQRAESGDFLGGERKDQGYSTKPIYAWKLGSLEKSSGSWRINPEAGAIVDPSSDDLIWRTVSGRATALLLTGYKGYRDLAGYETAHVNHTITGNMLRSIESKVEIKSKGLEIITTDHDGGQLHKIAGTNELRLWLALSEDELNQTEDMLVNSVTRLIEQLPPVTLT